MMDRLPLTMTDDYGYVSRLSLSVLADYLEESNENQNEIDLIRLQTQGDESNPAVQERIRELRQKLGMDEEHKDVVVSVGIRHSYRAVRCTLDKPIGRLYSRIHLAGGFLKDGTITDTWKKHPICECVIRGVRPDFEFGDGRVGRCDVVTLELLEMGSSMLLGKLLNTRPWSCSRLQVVCASEQFDHTFSESRLFTVLQRLNKWPNLRQVVKVLETDITPGRKRNAQGVRSS